MSDSWTSEQVLALAPDESSAKAGRGLASPRKWATLGRSETAAWGECQGSGKDPYQTQIDLSEPAFRCSCPSRKFPCKHGLGLFLTLVAQPAAFTAGEPPPWVEQWLAGRATRAEKKAQATAARAEAGETLVDAEAQARRVASRQARVAAGLEDLDLWLRDLVRRGLAEAQTQPYTYWENAAARLVDAQASGAARLVRELSGIPATGPGWDERLLGRLGRLYLLIDAFRRLEQLPPELQAEVRARLGWTQSQEEVLAGTGVSDTWEVVGQRVETEDHLRVQRTWLTGAQSGRPALVLSFAAAGQPLDVSLVPGTRFAGELAFFPGSPPLRALVKVRSGSPEPLSAITRTAVASDLTSALAPYAAALAVNPWLEAFPLAAEAVIPVHSGGHWSVRDQTDHRLPLSPAFSHGRRLQAFSGGHPVGVVGEWSGRHLLPLAAWAGGRYLALT